MKRIILFLIFFLPLTVYSSFENLFDSIDKNNEECSHEITTIEFSSCVKISVEKEIEKIKETSNTNWDWIDIFIEKRKNDPQTIKIIRSYCEKKECSNFQKNLLRYIDLKIILYRYDEHLPYLNSISVKSKTRTLSSAIQTSTEKENIIEEEIYSYDHKVFWNIIVWTINYDTLKLIPDNYRNPIDHPEFIIAYNKENQYIQVRGFYKNVDWTYSDVKKGIPFGESLFLENNSWTHFTIDNPHIIQLTCTDIIISLTWERPENAVKMWSSMDRIWCQKWSYKKIRDIHK